jgi:hypothetical protein
MQKLKKLGAAIDLKDLPSVEELQQMIDDVAFVQMQIAINRPN